MTCVSTLIVSFDETKKRQEKTTPNSYAYNGQHYFKLSRVVCLTFLKSKIAVSYLPLYYINLHELRRRKRSLKIVFLGMICLLMLGRSPHLL